MSHSSQRTSRRVRFAGGNGHTLAGVVDAPQGSPRGTIVLTHCFTCNKDYRAIVRISRALADRGIAVLRYDLTGLGDSDGDFSDCVFGDHIADCLAATRYAADEFEGVDVLCGYSLGGAASIAAADELPNLRGVATIGSPSDTQHLAALLRRMNPAIESSGEGLVNIGGREWLVRRPLVDSLDQYDLESDVRSLRVPALLFHSPQDETVDFKHARHLLDALLAAKVGVSLISLDDADHLLTRHRGDWDLIASMLAAWIVRRRDDR